jgi:hypothetical protein
MEDVDKIFITFCFIAVIVCIVGLIIKDTNDTNLKIEKIKQGKCLCQ